MLENDFFTFLKYYYKSVILLCKKVIQRIFLNAHNQTKN